MTDGEVIAKSERISVLMDCGGYLIRSSGARNRSVRSPDGLVFGSVWVPRPRLLRRDATQRPTFARPRSCQLTAARTATMADLVRSGRGGVPLLVAIYLGLRSAALPMRRKMPPSPVLPLLLSAT